MAKNLPDSVSAPLGPGDSGINPINIGGNSGLPSSVGSPISSGGSVGATKTSAPNPNKGTGGDVTLT